MARSDDSTVTVGLYSTNRIEEESIFIKRRRISVKLKEQFFRDDDTLNRDRIHLPGFGKIRNPISYSAVILGLLLILSNSLTLTFGRQHVFSNQFAVHIPAGDEKANEIAKKYGYDNLGQIGSLPKYYLFEASRVHKRSAEINQEHHELLSNDEHVHWFEQQVQKTRRKRDFNYFDVPSGVGPPYYSAQSFIQQSSQKRFSDPLYPEQWYLTGGSKDGFDMNVQAAWKKGYTGKGVTVSILDDGIQTNHPDLIQNYDPRASTDINGDDNDPMPQDNGDNKHGTRCAGEVAATAGNNICGVGVAYNASIGGVRMLDGTVNDAVEAKALGLNPEHIDIYSASWGPEDDGKTVDGPGPLARRAFIYGVSNGRRGLGSIFIWASGNGGRHVDSCNCDGYTNSIFTLSISSATQGGYKPWYLEECSSTLATTYSSGTPTLDKSVATVDMDARIRADHICTVEHTGTSASAPLAAGIVALALEANRNLSWRDLQHLVVITSRPNPLEKEQGWYVNGVKRKFSHKFGYGLMDAGAMVNMAANWAGVPPQHICKSREIREEKQIPGSHLGKVKVFMDVDGCAGSNSEIRFLEHVQCKISLRFFPRGNLRIQLTSPMGTTSVLLFERPRDVSASNFDDWPFLSIHFWGEQAHGRWTLEIVNSGSRRINQPGIFKKWQLILYGTDQNPIQTRTRQLKNFPPPPITSTQPFQSRPRYETGPPRHANYRQYQPIVTRQYSPPDFLYPGASEPVPQLQKQPSIRAQCENDYWVPDLSICVNDCPEGYYSSDTDQRECRSCSTRCKACYNSTSCTACEHNLVLLGAACFPSCPQGYYESDSSCNPCETVDCASCTGPTGNECIECKNRLLLHEGRCIPDCPRGFRSTSAGTCAACPPGCYACDAVKCLTCSNGFVFSDDEFCVEENPSCPRGLYLESETKRCLGCRDLECKHCDGANQCLECQGDLLLENGSCVSTCSDGFYAGFDNRNCFPCPKLCTTCNSPEECVACRSDGMLQGSKCLPSCLDGFYNNRGICHQCSRGCKTCLDYGNSECVTCNNGYRYTRNGSCLFSFNGLASDSNASSMMETYCGDGYWLNTLDKTCHPCHETCSRCTAGNAYNCRSCRHPLRFDRATSRCIQCCQNTEDKEDCCHCDGRRHALSEETSLTRGYSGECHFVSRRLSGLDDRSLRSTKWNHSTLLTFFWLLVMSLIVVFIIAIHQRRKKWMAGASEYVSPATNAFKRRRFLETTKKYDSLYKPVSLSPCDDDEDDARSFLIKPDNNLRVFNDLDSEKEDRKGVQSLFLQT